MKKKLMALITATAMVLSLAACGGSSSSAAGSTETAEATTSAAESAVESKSESAAESKVDSAVESKTESAVESTADASAAGGETEIQVFIAASLNTVMQEIAAKYNEAHPNVSIVFNADSSGKLLTQIEEGYTCDVFFSAAQKQMNALEEDGLIVEGTSTTRSWSSPARTPAQKSLGLPILQMQPASLSRTAPYRSAVTHVSP